MSVESAFDAYQTIVNADPKQVKEARRRRDLFKTAFAGEVDVEEVRASGSLARGTQKDPIHDVDTIIVFNSALHPGWGRSGDSAEEALNHVQARVRELLGTDGTHAAGEVRRSQWRNHAVKCFLDDKDDQDAFTVDAMPALRDGDQFIIPEFSSKTWVPANPQYLIDEIAVKHVAWRKFAGTVRMLKSWGKSRDIEIKSLVMEVLSLGHLPTGNTRPVALRTFFTTAAYAIENGMKVSDPANICGEIQNDLDYTRLAELLRSSSEEAALAVLAQASNDDAAAIGHWGNVFGDKFPNPPKSGKVPAVVPPVAPRPVKDTPQG
jgi:hypothetical protein